MTGCSIAAWVPSLDQLEAAAAIAGSVVMLASALCALFPKPAPGSRWAKARAVLETAAMMVGHARGAGLIRPPPASVENFTQRAVDFSKALRAPNLAAALLLAAVLTGATAAVPIPPPAVPIGRSNAAAVLLPSFAAAPPPELPPATPIQTRSRLLRATSTFTFDQGPDGRLVVRSLAPAR